MPPAATTAYRRPSEWQPPQFSAEHRTFAHSSAHPGGGAHISKGRNGMHYVRVLLAAAPLIIGELVPDPQKRWRYIRLASLVGVVLMEGAHQRGQWQDHVSRGDEGRER